MSAIARTERRGRLALCFQEAFTSAARLKARGSEAPSDAAAFRMRVQQLIRNADQEARQLGYGEAEIRLAQYAVIVFVDEAVLHSGIPEFADWPRMPLQEEVFGNNIGGSTFFEYLRTLMEREISEDVADVLEVYQLCLLLGFRGQYRAGDGTVDALMSKVGERIQRYRETPADLAPTWRLPPGEHFEAPKDIWLRRLRISAAVAWGLVVVAYLAYSMMLSQGIGTLSALGR